MKIDILTLFPEMFTPLEVSMIGRARSEGIIDINITNIRNYTLDKHKKVDEYPFGGGKGMLMQVEPIDRALDAIKARDKEVYYMSPRGKVLNEDAIKRISQLDDIVIVCGHYEGLDERAIELWKMKEVSIGDFVLTGGELPAMVLVDAVARHIPGVLGDSICIEEESIYSGLLEAPQYTKPREYRGRRVPEVLLSGHHEHIELWKLEQSLEITSKRRRDLLEKYIRDVDARITSGDKPRKKVRAIIDKYR